ncbi:hypothetical protein SAMN02910456_01106 [Ruminococcaceae bacterium YRB3002]|nr:hypothetical protein SAMN02910456_01106 [Ruminococcaceae bacterium YRB3002]
MDKWVNSADTFKCPGCSGNLFYDSDSNSLICKFCGNSFNPDIFDMLEAFSKVENEEGDAAEDDGKHEIVCASCGAVVITDENTASSICCYCGSPALSARRLTKEFRPDYILPFKVTKEEARRLFIDWTKQNKYIPKDFASEQNINKLTGLYVPFWLVDCKCDAEFYGTGYINDGANRGVFSLSREISFYLSRVPFDGSRKISDRLMAAVEPFDYSELRPYKDSYLPGYYAERYDQTPLELSKKVSTRTKRYAEETIKLMSCGQYDEVSFNNGYSSSSEFKHSYALLPVWFMNYQYDGINYGFAINGQTGEVCGDLPFDKFRRGKALAQVALTRLVLPLLILAAVILVPYIMFILDVAGYVNVFSNASVAGEVLGRIFAIGVYVAIPVVLFFIARFVAKWRVVSNTSQNPIDPPPKVEQYYDGTKKPEIRKEDKFISTMVRPKEPSGSWLVRILTK